MHLYEFMTTYQGSSTASVSLPLDNHSDTLHKRWPDVMVDQWGGVV